MVEPRVLKGFRDYLPDVEEPRQRMLAAVRQVFESFGFGPVQTPALEYADVLMGKYGDEGDKLLYRFLDNGERDVAMRYDLTVPLARLIGEHGGKLALPFKRYQMAPVWRAEKPGKGRFREFMQCDADIVGEPGNRADAEIMLVGLGVLRALGVPAFVMRVNDRRILDAALEHAHIDRAQLLPVLRVVDKLPKIGRDAVAAELTSEIQLTPEQSDRLLSLLAREVRSPEDLAQLALELAATSSGAAGVQGLSELLAMVDAAGLGANVAVDLSIARGLDYYTSTIYETFLVGHESYGSVMSGGRYDGLMGTFSKAQVPAVGISLGVDRLLAALIDLDLLKARAAGADVFLTYFSDDEYGATAKIAAELRQAGLRVELALSAQKLGKQIKLAERKGYRWVFIVGAAERERGEVIAKDLSNGSQTALRLADVGSWVSQFAS